MYNPSNNLTLYVDVDGLSTLPTRKEREDYALALGYDQTTFIAQTDRFTYLNRLRTSNGEVVVVGPAARGFWSLISFENFIRVEPDGYDYAYRTTNEVEWSYRAQGLNDHDVQGLLALKTSPTPRHHLYNDWSSANTWLSDLRSSAATVTPQKQEQSSNYTIVTESQAQLSLLDKLFSEDELIALDFEWIIDDSKRYGHTCIGINIATSAHAWYLPFIGPSLPTSLQSRTVLARVFQGIRTHSTVWHNFKSDLGQYLSDPLDLFGSPVHDTILMAYVAGEQKLGLKDLTEKLLHRKATPFPKNSKLEELPLDVAARYGAAGDTRNTLDLFYKLKQKLEDTGQWDVYNDIERSLVPVLASMERYGIPLDMNEVQKLRDKYWADEEAIRDTIINSMGLDFQKDEDQRAYVGRHGFHSETLDKRVLSKLTGGWVEPLLQYRELRTLRRNFLDKHLDGWNLQGRPDVYSLYPTFNQAGRDTSNGSFTNAPATGRLSSASPNLQNQPRAIRSIFTAPPGNVLVSLDYSALELRIAASISQDPVMLGVLQSGGDLHQAMRDTILAKTGIDVGRPIAKTANFNLRYGGQADMLMTIAAKAGSHLDYATASAIVEVDRETYKGYWKWFENVISEARKWGYSSSLYGRRRYNDNLFSNEQMRRGTAERAAANMAVQGTGADILKLVMAKLIPILGYFEAHLALQVHDELVFWVPEEVAARFVVAAKGIMESIKIPSIGLFVGGGPGRTWAEAH